MYEIWLALNIVYEIALGLWPALLILLAVWLAVMVTNRQGLASVSLTRLLAIAVVVAIAVGLALPSLTLSSFGNFGYWVDWANWLAMAVGAGVVAAVWVWPLMARRSR